MKVTSTLAVLFASGYLWCGAAFLGASPLPPRNSGDQSTESADRGATQKIRKAVIADKNLSTSAHNVNISVKDGKVTLRGPVRSDDEKRTVGEMASSVVGADNVINELTVQPQK